MKLSLDAVGVDLVPGCGGGTGDDTTVADLVSQIVRRQLGCNKSGCSSSCLSGCHPSLGFSSPFAESCSLFFFSVDAIFLS